MRDVCDITRGFDRYRSLTLSVAVLASAPAPACLDALAAVSIHLAGYQLAGEYAPDTLGGLGLGASAVTSARDRGRLFLEGGEGLGMVDISLTGRTDYDTEGRTYLGNGQRVRPDERPQRAYPPRAAPWRWATRPAPPSATGR